MDNESGILRIGIPTGFGTNGVRKEAVKIAKAMLTEMGSGKIDEKWGKYFVPSSSVNFPFDFRWGVMLTTEVSNLEYAKSIMLSFDYDDILMTDAEKLREDYRYYGKPYPNIYNYTKIVGDDYIRNNKVC